ncbi:hypothetical protein [Halorussus amylolyticus]|uniref:hypothetical protein n=1 Tax=Halorussus amylolyticus TaxID=1126242 RepID=UPI00104F4D4D|nr:hypothetical protein [Halorussus amylolyticus]
MTAAIGAGSSGTASAQMSDTMERGARDPDATLRSIVIKSSDRSSYQFSVSGVLTATDAPDDAVESGTATATVSDGVHQYEFSGEFTGFDVSGDPAIRVDGKEFDADSYLDQSVEIIPRGQTTVDVSASGRIEAESPRSDSAKSGENGPESLDRVNGRTLQGTITTPVSLVYTGELTFFDADSEVHFKRDGDRVDAADILPSSMPGGVTVTGEGESFKITTSDQADKVGADTTVEDGTITGTANETATEARYDGNLVSVSRGDATATISSEQKRVICSAPSDSSVEFTINATEAVIYDDAVHETLTTTVAADATERIKFLGEVTSLGVGGVTAEFDSERYPEAAVSARLQTGAVVERTDAFERAASEADGRVRHDPEGIYLVSNTTDDKPSDSTVHHLTDLDRGDEGAITISRHRDSGEVAHVETVYEWKTKFDTTSKVTSETLQLAGAASVQAASVETTTEEYNVPEDRLRSAGDPVTTQGLIDDASDFIGDIWDGLTGVVDSIAGLGENMLQTVIEDSGVDQNDLAVSSGQIVCNSITAIQDLATELINTKYVYDVAKWSDVDLGKVLWKVRLTGYDSVVSVATSDAFAEFGDDDWSCGSCIAIIRLALDVGICGFGVSAFCAGTNWWNLGLGAAPCTVALGALCSLAVATLPDARDLCSAANEPTGWSVC